MAKKTNARQDSCVKLIFRKYYLYIKSDNQKYYLSISVMLNLTRTHFVRELILIYLGTDFDWFLIMPY